MNKATPKDGFKAHSDRAAPLLAKLKDAGISHLIDGKSVPSSSMVVPSERIDGRQRRARPVPRNRVNPHSCGCSCVRIGRHGDRFARRNAERETP